MARGYYDIADDSWKVIPECMEEARIVHMERALRSLFVSPSRHLLDVLFVGECTHDFTVAAGALCGMFKPTVPADTGLLEQLQHLEECPKARQWGDYTTHWCSTELRWPTEQDVTSSWLHENLMLLQRAGVWCSNNVDVSDLGASLTRQRAPKKKFDTIVWTMPHPLQGKRNIPQLELLNNLKDLIRSFVVNATQAIKCVDSDIVVVVTSQQMRAMHLHTLEVKLDDGRIFSPTVLPFPWAPLVNRGYEPHYGNLRDNEKYAVNTFFHQDQCVAVLWHTGPVLPDVDDPRDHFVGVGTELLFSELSHKEPYLYEHIMLDKQIAHVWDGTILKLCGQAHGQGKQAVVPVEVDVWIRCQDVVKKRRSKQGMVLACCEAEVYLDRDRAKCGMLRDGARLVARGEATEGMLPAVLRGWLRWVCCGVTSEFDRDDYRQLIQEDNWY